MVEGSDGESSIFCGPLSDDEEDGALAELRSLEAWGIWSAGGGFVGEDLRAAGYEGGKGERGDAREAREGGGAGDGRRREEAQGRARGEGGRQREGAEGGRNRGARGERAEAEPQVKAQDLILPKGDVEGDNQKFVCVFQIGLEDDEEFCLVKRILGKAGNNMRRIAEECSAKVRLRGIGSGFLEGANGREANMPLQLNVSCTDYEGYKGGVDRVSALLSDLYKHYKRYIKSKGQDPPKVKVSLEEVRRDDLGVDLLAQKARRSSSQRERERRLRDSERRHQRDKEKGSRVLESELGDTLDGGQGETLEDGQEKPRFVLPGGGAVPTTPAGRRAAARAGGAAAAAVVSAAAREAERLERERTREDRERSRREVTDRSTTASNRQGRNGARGGKGGGAFAAAVAAAADSTPTSGKGNRKAPPPPPPSGPPPQDATHVGGWQTTSGGRAKGGYRRGSGDGW